MLNYYVDPGSGFVFAQGTSFLWGIILGLFGTGLFLFKFFFRFLKKFIWILLILVALSILIIGGIMMHKPANNKKVIIIGIDAMDPNITGQLINEGKLPNFSYLKKAGAYSHLATSIPSESVVAWTSFATGLNPGGHGIFDFIMRNPDNYSLYLSLNEVKNIDKEFSLGPMKIPIGNTLKIESRQKTGTFWNILSKNKIPCLIYFCPNTFPAQPLYGRMLSGMGVPDLYGTIGRFSFYTSQPLTDEDKDSRGKIVQAVPKDNVIDTELYGPKLSAGSSVTESTVPLKIIVDSSHKKVSIKFQGKHFVLQEGNWSGWEKVSFKVAPFKNACGIVRFYLKSIEPDFELYASPINFDPESPLFPISYPYAYSKELAKKVGPYYTQGMPHDTWALTENRLDEKTFLEHVDGILNERERILKEELKEFKGGLFFFYFETLDVIQHMYWRYLDSQHPLYVTDPWYQDTVYRYYEKIDRIIGDILKKLDRDTTLIILSDHGFGPFRRAFHLNRWLLENGFLSLKPGINESREFLEDVDWSKTKAYALGFGGIYLNRIGREYYGTVVESEVQNIKNAIARGLREFKDPQNGEKVVNNVYFSEDVFNGPYINDAPDLFVGFKRGYRASWQTALGGVPPVLIEDNQKKWSGDHLIDPALVPGVIFVNKKVDLENPAIVDIAPTLLALWDIAEPNQMQGKILFKNEDKINR